MSDYNSIVAKHYAAYRPGLHHQILHHALGNNPGYTRGLDIGCGTGQSSHALADFCEKVYGVEPMADMLRLAIAHPAVKYLHYDGQNIPIQKESINIITLAGSLFYAKSQQLVDEINRVALPGALVIVYDFDIRLDNWYDLVAIPASSLPTEYDHRVDFSGLAISPLVKQNYTESALTFEVTLEEMAHLMLSVSKVTETLNERWNTSDPFEALIRELHPKSLSPLRLTANTFCTVYQKSDPSNARPV